MKWQPVEFCEDCRCSVIGIRALAQFARCSVTKRLIKINSGHFWIPDDCPLPDIDMKSKKKGKVKNES